MFGHHIANLVSLPSAVAGIAGFGHLGVTFFFVLSGFVLTWSWRPSVDIPTFYWRRFARIYPLTVVTLALAIPVFYSFAPDPAQPWVKPFDLTILVLSLLLLQGWSRDPVVLFGGNPAAWTLTVEMFFYAMHPLVIAALRRAARRGALIAAAAVLALTVATRFGIVSGALPLVAGLPWPILRLNEFVLGMCLAWAMRQGWRPRLHPLVPTALLLGFFVLLDRLGRSAAAEPVYLTVAPYTNEIVTALCAVLIVSAASADLRGRSRLMTVRPVVALGEWSYAFYLIHATVIYAALELFGYRGGGWAAVGWTTGVLAGSIAAAWALHVYIERPLEKRLRTWQSRRRTSGRSSADIPPPAAGPGRTPSS